MLGHTWRRDLSALPRETGYFISQIVKFWKTSVVRFQD